MTDTNTDTTTSGTTKFSVWLADHARGALDDELTAAMAEVCQAVILQEKAGKVTLNVAITEEAGVLVIKTSVQEKLPQEPNGAFYYLGKDGMPSRRDPNQPQLPTLED